MKPLNPAPLALVVGETALACITEDLLLAEGFDVVVAHGLAAAETITAKLTLVVVDQHPGAGLFSRCLIGRLRRANPDLPIVVVTDNDEEMPEAGLLNPSSVTVRMLKAADYLAFTRVVWGLIDRAKRCADMPDDNSWSERLIAA
ncbi:hypothetical protein CKO45_06070 [Paracraurococcus ruber]|uniref:Response regulator receiver domain-containing protein n=2 Tax=Paracraurococcus ruber TaxID=77675 RepID=A0ABS1CTI6_9PROT|nr:hypothetical protein [Paracraurococcus ruber]